MAVCTRCSGTGVEPSGLTLVNEVRDSPFEAFWELYPRKQAKATARSRWHRMSEADRRLALEAMPAHVAMWNHEGRGTRLIPMATTWLNQRRWEDDLTGYVESVEATARKAMPGRGGIAAALARRATPAPKAIDPRRMSWEDAEQLLGVDELAPPDEIIRAHQEKVHDVKHDVKHVALLDAALDRLFDTTPDGDAS